MIESVTYTARWVIPVAGPSIPDGVIAVAGERITYVGRPKDRTPDIDFGNAAIIPGLVNAHTHLDLTGAKGRIPFSGNFTAWLKGVIEYRRSRTAEQIRTDIREGINQCLVAGTTLVGDVSAGGASWPLLAASPLRAVVYYELIGLAKIRAEQAWADFLRWKDSIQPTAMCRPGVSPHAPYSVHRCLFEIAAASGLPVAVHLAEVVAERELLEHRRGEMREFLSDVGAWDASGLTDNWAEVLDALSPAQSMSLIHGNYVAATDPIPPHATIVYCPRTNAAFEHLAHPFRSLVTRDIRVAIGTDSLASNPDLSVLSETRFIYRRFPDYPGAMLLRMATLSGAEALGWADETGSLEPRKSADFVVFPLPDADDNDPYRLLFTADEPPAAVFFRGREIDRRSANSG